MQRYVWMNIDALYFRIYTVHRICLKQTRKKKKYNLLSSQMFHTFSSDISVKKDSTEFRSSCPNYIFFLSPSYLKQNRKEH